MTGQGSVGRIGRMNKVDKKYLVNQRVGIIRARETELVDKDFLCYFVARNCVEKMYFGLAQGAGQPNISPNDIGGLVVKLPSLAIQKKIAGILSKYDDLLENNLKQISLLEEAAQNIYQEWFVNFRFPEHEQALFDDETGLPEGWRLEEVGSFADVNSQSLTKKKAPNDILYVDISSTHSGYFSEPIPYKFTEAPGRARRVVKEGDTIFSTVRPKRKSYAFILFPPDNLIVSTGFAVATPKIKAHAEFLYSSIISDAFVNKASSIAKGAAYPAISQKDFESIKMVIPDEKTIFSFHSLVSSVLRLKGRLLSQNQKLKEAKDILLPRLMNQTIKVD
jgi:type I restriction enzyme S subunit